MYALLRTTLSIVGLAMVGCTTIGSQPAPADWPQLKVEVRRVSFVDAQSSCGGNLLIQAMACAEVDFCARTCTINLWLDSVLEHEKQHCAGRDHEDSTWFADQWAYFKADGKGFCRLRMGEANFCAKWPEFCK